MLSIFVIGSKEQEVFSVPLNPLRYSCPFGGIFSLRSKMEEENRKRNKGGRPPKIEKQEYKLSFNATLSDKQFILAKAQRSGVRLADYLRDIALKGKVRDLPTAEEIQQTRDLTGVANNLNQLTKEAHKQNLAFFVPDLLDLLTKLHKTLEAIDNKSKNG